MRPKYAIVIPCRNEENFIGKCLGSLLALDYPNELLEVYVCDGLSTDNTQTIVQDFEKEHQFIKLLINEAQTTPHALNLGIKSSEADIIIILGAHAELYPGYINGCNEVFALDENIGCAGGVIENIPLDKRSATVAAAMSSAFGVGNAHFRTGGKEGYVDTVAFGAYKKEVFRKIGYFDEDLVRNQDDEFNFRLIRAGFKIYLSRKIRAKYYVRPSISKLRKQFYQYGYWKVYVNKKYGTVTTGRQLVPLLFVLFLILGAVLSLILDYFLIVYLAIIFLYLFLAFVVALKEKIAIGSIFLMLASFLTMHISYGWGYLEGIINFILLNRKPKKTSGTLSR